MSNTKVEASGNSIGSGFLLFLVFLVLRLTGVISWSWWWVTAPLWIPFAFVTVVFVVGFVAYILYGERMW